jgi:transposase-like protein
MESVMAKKVRGYRRYPVGMKQQVVGRMEAGENVKALARELGIDRTLLYVWKRKAAGQPYGSAAGQPQDLRDQRIRELEAKVGQLEGALGRQVQEVDFFAAALRGIAALRRQKSGSGERASTEKSADAPKRKAK